MDCTKSLSKTDLVHIMDITYKLLSIRTTIELENCFKELQNLFIYDSAMCALTDIESLKNKKPLYHLSTLNFSEEFVERYAKGLYYVKSSVFNAVLTQNKPCHWKSYWLKTNSGEKDSGRTLAQSYGYRDGWIDATRCQRDQSFALLIFAGKKVDANSRAESIIEYITPHFSESIRRVCNSHIRKLKHIARYKLTQRELEVLNWIKEGKSSWEISCILNCSERVVIWHANNIIMKLEANNRTHAVAIAMRKKLIN